MGANSSYSKKEDISADHIVIQADISTPVGTPVVGEKTQGEQEPEREPTSEHEPGTSEEESDDESDIVMGRIWYDVMEDNVSVVFHISRGERVAPEDYRLDYINVSSLETMRRIINSLPENTEGLEQARHLVDFQLNHLETANN